MRVGNDPKVDKKIRSLPLDENSRIVRVIELFKEGGFGLNETYLKKLSHKVWELRAGKWRLLFGIINNEAIIVNIFQKKTQKTPRREIDLAIKRLTQYI